MSVVRYLVVFYIVSPDTYPVYPIHLASDLVITLTLIGVSPILRSQHEPLVLIIQLRQSQLHSLTLKNQNSDESPLMSGVPE